MVAVTQGNCSFQLAVSVHPAGVIPDMLDHRFFRDLSLALHRINRVVIPLPGKQWPIHDEMEYLSAVRERPKWHDGRTYGCVSQSC